MPANESPKRRPSRTASRRSKVLPGLPSKIRPGLAVDTSFTRHRANAPQQVFPYESTKQELSFVSLHDIKALKKQKKSSNNVRRTSRSSLAPRQQQGFSSERSTRGGYGPAPPPAYSPVNVHGTEKVPVLHQRVKGLRLSPLNVSTDISPSDRAITIGISVDPDAVSSHSKTPSSAVAGQIHPQNTTQRRPSQKLKGQEVVTPTIVITPAREDFDFELPHTQSPEDLGRDLRRHRVASSVYSRYTNCMPVKGQTPPVPPLPLFARDKPGRKREFNATVFEEEDAVLAAPKGRRENNLSVCTVFEEDRTTARNAKRLTSQSHLPTPRRSRGWWNLVTSPFSASSRSNAFFWRSPSPQEEGKERMLDDASQMGRSDSHAGMIFTNRTSHDLDLRSAPPIGLEDSSLGLTTGMPRQPKRSDTAPGALDPNGEDGVNIYNIPWVGAAAEYYNPHKHFGSVIVLPEDEALNRGIEGWSPSQSVYHEPRKSARGVVAHVDDDNDSLIDTGVDDPFDDDQQDKSKALEVEKSPSSDAHASTTFQDFSGTHPAATADKKFFQTPAEDELRDARSPRSVRPDMSRGETLESYFSPLSATPIVEDARLATFGGPREVDVHSTRAASPYGPGLGATMASRGIDDDRPMSEKAPFRHQRNDSYGLGIETDGESEKCLFPPPKPLAQQPRLGTDRFGQLTIEQPSERDPNRRLWYQRLLWPLVGLATALLVLIVVLLVLFVSQPHNDMPVQAQWLNLTGFPAMPTGIATVIQPKSENEVTSCVKPDGLWSCAAPASVNTQQSTGLPNFRFEVRFRNKTSPEMNSTDVIPTPDDKRRRHLGSSSRATMLVRRNGWKNSLFASTPSPPSTDEMIFIGNTTDQIRAPFDGEETPFYISLLNGTVLFEQDQSTTRRLLRRERGAGAYPYPSSSGTQTGNITQSGTVTDAESSSKDTSTQASTKIPRPLLDVSGQPAPAQLYPLAFAQPLRLFNRGQDSEHYGFYTYFDRSVYVATSNFSESDPESSSAAFGANVTSNTPLEQSNAVCTFSQTRFHVQIWTRKPLVSTLSSAADTNVAAADSSANDMDYPGSFPYAVTIRLDRHGGNAERKGVYCYGLNADQHVDMKARVWVAENRANGGTLVNPADVPGANETSRLVRRDESGTGIDGGDGGCACSWQT